MVEIFLASGRCKFGGGQFNMWTKFEETQKVNLTELDVGVYLVYGKLLIRYVKAYFDPSIWCVGSFGLVYTDDIFNQELVDLLNHAGFAVTLEDVNYSEQGMQGTDYIHFDATGEWIEDRAKIKQLRIGLIETSTI